MSYASHRRYPLMAIAGLLLLGAVGAHLDSGAKEISAEPHWVRTRDGWERATWTVPKAAPEAAPHPLTLALFVGLVSVTALVGLPCKVGNLDRCAESMRNRLAVSDWHVGAYIPKTPPPRRRKRFQPH